MNKFLVFSLATGLALTLSTGLFGSPNQADAWAGKDCSRTTFKTKMVENACKEGGQKAAKKAMKSFVKAVKKAEGGDPDLACDSCHKDLSPDYPLNDKGLKMFKKYEKLAK